MDRPASRWIVDPDDPRAPPHEVWVTLSPDERADVLASLPSEFPVSEAVPPEGDHHSDNAQGSRQTLRRFFARGGRNVYVGSNLPVYYPAERMFAPDVFAVLDVDPHPREHWTVDAEGRGLDVAIEVNVSGRRDKDLRDNVARYARLGIPEYFVVDWRRQMLHGWALPPGDKHVYERQLPQRGRYLSHVLGLELGFSDGRLRFFVGDAEVPDTDELVKRLSRASNDAVYRADEEARRADEEKLRADALVLEVESLRRRLAELEKS